MKLSHLGYFTVHRQFYWHSSVCTTGVGTCIPSVPLLRSGCFGCQDQINICISRITWKTHLKPCRDCAKHAAAATQGAFGVCDSEQAFKRWGFPRYLFLLYDNSTGFLAHLCPKLRRNLKSAAGGGTNSSIPAPLHRQLKLPPLHQYSPH